MKLDDLDFYAIGNSIRMAGAIYADDGHMYLCLFPGEELPESAHTEHLDVLQMDLPEWQRFIRQTDVLETEVLAQSADGKMAKAIIRKSARQIAAHVQWAVFKRDHYHCRYYGKDGIPMTVDHLVTWEEGGPSTVENLVCACRKCNKMRGNTKYADWLNHPHYLKMSAHLPIMVADQNRTVANTLDDIPRLIHKPKR